MPLMCSAVSHGLLRRRSGSLRGEPACRPGSVTTLPATWEHSPRDRLTCGFTSHYFSTVPASFHALAELRRNWQTSGRRWRSQPGSYLRTNPPRETIRPRWSSLGDRSVTVDLDVFDTQSRLVAIAAQRVQHEAPSPGRRAEPLADIQPPALSNLAARVGGQ